MHDDETEHFGHESIAWFLHQQNKGRVFWQEHPATGVGLMHRSTPIVVVTLVAVDTDDKKKVSTTKPIRLSIREEITHRELGTSSRGNAGNESEVGNGGLHGEDGGWLRWLGGERECEQMVELLTIVGDDETPRS